MKTISLIILLTLVSCSGSESGGGKVLPAPQVSIGNDSHEDNKAFQEQFQLTVQTLPQELKIKDEDKEIIKAEIQLTPEETQALNQLQ